MQVDRTNFEQVLPTLIDDIKQSDFVSFDCQFTGLVTQLQRIEGMFPNYVEFYERIKQTAYNFNIIQLGLTTFKYNGQNYIPVPYNIYVQPVNHTPALNNVLLCEVESMEFLAHNHMDFSRVFKFGVGGKRLYADEERSKHQNHPMQKYHHEEMFFCPDDSAYVEEVQKHLQPLKESHKMDRVVDFKTKQILTYFKSKYENLATDKPKKNMKQFEYSVRLLQQHKYEEKMEEEMKKEFSLQDIFSVLIKCQKPIVGHFPNLDLGLLYHNFIAPLPESYEEFCGSLNKLLPFIYDTKVLSRRIQPKLKGIKVDLPSLFQSCFKKNLLEPFANIFFQQSPYLSKQLKHEAGYDAFMTGYAFIGMANFFNGARGRINFKALENENKILYSRFSGEVSLKELLPSEWEKKIVIGQSKTEQEWKEAGELLSKMGNLSVHQDHGETYYLFEKEQNIPEVITLLPQLHLKPYSQRKIIKAYNIYSFL